MSNVRLLLIGIPGTEFRRAAELSTEATSAPNICARPEPIW